VLTIQAKDARDLLTQTKLVEFLAGIIERH